MAYDQRGSRCRKCFSLDQGQKEHQPPRRRSDRRIHSRARCGEGFGVHICTGPVAVRGAEPGDILEARIIDVKPCGCRNPEYKGKAFGNNAAAWWGFQYNDLLTEPKPREVITIYELDTSGEKNWARPVCNFSWITQIDPFGVAHKIIEYPGVPVDHGLMKENYGVLKNLRIPICPHFGVIALAPTRSISV